MLVGRVILLVMVLLAVPMAGILGRVGWELGGRIFPAKEVPVPTFNLNLHLGAADAAQGECVPESEPEQPEPVQQQGLWL